ncbi:MAG: hypothetical protein ACLSVD_01825 [Eggerthellaceae bacterium]
MLHLALLLYLGTRHRPERNYATLMEMLRAGGARGRRRLRLGARRAVRPAGDEGPWPHRAQILPQLPLRLGQDAQIHPGDARLQAGEVQPRRPGALTATDELDLPSLGERKVALFAVIPDNDTSFNFLVSVLYTQLFQQLFALADGKHGGRLRARALPHG